MSTNPATGLMCLGSKTEIAAKFGVTPEAIRQWFEGGIPADRALQAEELTDGKVAAMDVLRYAKKKRRNGHKRAA